jgi:Resolvase, N terminal domain
MRFGHRQLSYYFAKGFSGLGVNRVLLACRCANRPNSTNLVLLGSRVRPNFPTVLGLEVSRLARNNADWYRLLDLCGITDTLISDADCVYHPAMFNDRLLLGLKGTVSEAERARLLGGDPQQGGARRTASQSSCRLRLG